MMTLYFWSFFFRNIDYDLLYFTSISIAAVAQRLESSLLVLSVVGSITKDGPSWLFSRQEFEVKWRIKSPRCYKMVLSYEYRTFTAKLNIHVLLGTQIFKTNYGRLYKMNLYFKTINISLFFIRMLEICFRIGFNIGW